MKNDDTNIDIISGIKVVSVEPDTSNFIGGTRITIKREDGKLFIVNVPDESWGDGLIYGLNMVFDKSGGGDHYT